MIKEVPDPIVLATSNPELSFMISVRQIKIYKFFCIKEDASQFVPLYLHSMWKTYTAL